MPSFLNTCACGDFTAEARQTVGTLLRGEQAYFLEHQTFTDRLGDLGLGWTEETVGKYGAYTLHLPPTGDRIYVFGVSKKLRRYEGDDYWVGAVFTRKKAAGERASVSILCRGSLPELPDKMPSIRGPVPTLRGDQPVCPPEMRPYP